MAGSSSEDEEQQSLAQRVLSKALAPLHIATSKPALKAYLGTILFLGASSVLLAVSTTAYLLFYYNFVPQVGLSRVIHLQYADGPFPHSTTYLTASSLVSLQPYDVTIHLHLPRTPTNLAAGNFMIDLSLISPPVTTDQPLSLTSVLAPSNTSTLLARSRRPAMLPYQSPITSLTNTVLSLPLHTISLRDIDATSLSIPMFERVSFAKGRRNLPMSARLEIQTQPYTQAAMLGQLSADAIRHVPLQVYSARIEFRARFRGLRWMMYNWRILSFFIFTGAFYGAALFSTGIVWGASTLLAPSSAAAEKYEERRKIKQEEDSGLRLKATNGQATRPIKSEPSGEAEDEGSAEESGLSLSNLSDTATTFPTLGRQMPIRYPIQRPFRYDSTPASGSGSGRIKKEDADDIDYATNVEATTAIESLAAAATTAGEFAEDEYEDDDGDEDEGLMGTVIFGDSGLGTSMEESAREAAGLQRRRGARDGRGASSGSRNTK